MFIDNQLQQLSTDRNFESTFNLALWRNYV